MTLLLVSKVLILRLISLIIIVIEEEAQEEGPQFSQESIDQLTMMGFGINRAKRALLENGHNVEQAMNWLCERIDDPSKLFTKSGLYSIFL